MYPNGHGGCMQWVFLFSTVGNVEQLIFKKLKLQKYDEGVMSKWNFGKENKTQDFKLKT